MNENVYRAQYIEQCRENIRELNTEYAVLLIRQKREPNPHKKAQLDREISMTKSEINANWDDIRVTEEIMRNVEKGGLIGLAYQNQ